MFSPVDWFVIVLYFAAVAGIGVYFSRRNRDFKDFMFGGGNMPWLAVGISLIATSVSANTFLGNPADGYANDMRLLMLNVGSLAAIAIVGTVFIPRIRSSGIKSAYELLETKFSRPVRVMAASFYSFHLLLRMGMLIYGPSLVLMRITGAPYWACAVAMAVFAMLYTSLGGIKAVTTTDIIQFIIFFGGGLLCIAFVARAVGGFGAAWHMASEAGKTRWLDFTWDPSSPRNFWTASLVYIVFEVAIRGCDQQFVQRYLSTKNLRAANYSSVTSSLLGICVGMVFFTVGAFLYVYFQIAHVEVLPDLKANQVLPHFIVNVLPTGIKGLLVAAILAADMGALSSVLTALSNTTVIDFLRRDRGGEGSHSLKHARIWVVLWGTLGTAASFICALGDETILGKALFFTSLFTGPLLSMFLQAFFLPKTRPAAIMAGAIVGMLSLLPFSTIPVLPPGAWKPWLALAWPWNPLISLTGSLLAAQAIDAVMGRGGGGTETERRTRESKSMKKLLLLIVVLAIAGFLFIYSGRYDISAATPHWSLVKKLISITVDQSVKHHAEHIAAPNLDDTAMVRMGFEHYQEMCVDCHGAPGVKPEEFAQGLYPKAPRLKHPAGEWSPAELYWMTKYGIKMSGMPAFGATHDEHELWSIVAFLKKLPSMDSAGYAGYKALIPSDHRE